MPDPTRREFLHGAARLVAGGAAAAAAAPLTAACAAPDPTRAWTFRTALDVSALSTDGQSMVSANPGVDGARILVVRTAPGAFAALSTQCTHEGCPVNPPVNGVITCPCHGSQYALDGTVKRGPALYALMRYRTWYDARSATLVVGVTD